MLWPGTLIYAEEKITGLGVAAYALLAAGGDMGASVAPQLVGIISDLSNMRFGILAAALFPLCGIFLILIMKKYFKKKEKSLGKE
jgi:MFS-type transporter involved in bile tolerance (Atg22 family)